MTVKYEKEDIITEENDEEIIIKSAINVCYEIGQNKHNQLAVRASLVDGNYFWFKKIIQQLKTTFNS